jgi:hypothetical protein
MITPLQKETLMHHVNTVSLALSSLEDVCRRERMAVKKMDKIRHALEEARMLIAIQPEQERHS